PSATDPPVTAVTSTAPPSTTPPSTTPASTTAPRPTTTAPAPATTVPASAPAFAATTLRVTAGDLGASWRAGCPVPPADLRKLELSYWGFDAQAHTGSLVVNASEVDKVTDVFRRLYDRRFPIRRMETIDAYGGDDDAS